MAIGTARSGWDIDLKEGIEREEAFSKFLRERDVVLIEHKCDELCWKTGNLFVEYKQKGRPSGIAVTTADAWAFEFLPNHWLIVPTLELKALCRRAFLEKRIKQGGDNNNYLGVLLPIKWITGSK